MKTTKTKSIFWGVIASLGMALFYVFIMFLTMPYSEVWYQFVSFWYLIIGIVIGFGIQIGLWVYIKNCGHMDASGGVAGASGAMSGTAMLACCAHHLADVLPILGLSGAAIFLTQYQRPFLVLGLSINLLGIAYMLRILGKQTK